MNDKARIQNILQTLEKNYPTATIALNFTNPIELLIAVILSAQCTDIQVNRVTQTLFQKYKTLDDYLVVSKEIFEQDIKSTGFYRNKAKHIQKALHIIKEQYNGEVPHSMEKLLTLPGVARKTANVVLTNAYNVVVGIAVDTHVMRLSERLQLVSSASYRNPEKIEKELMRILPKNAWKTITYQLIDHGRAICQAKKPHCSLCPLAPFCPSRNIEK